MITIALAEDNLQMRAVISSIITQLSGCSVSIEAGNGLQLIERLNLTNKLPQIAIVDVQMPVMDGLAVTDFITKHYPSINILAMSIHHQPMVIQDMLQAGAKGYIVKDNLSVPLLSRAITKLIAGNIFLDGTVGNEDFFKPPIISRHVKGHTAYADITEKEKTFLQLSTTAGSYEQIARLMNVAKESVYNYQKSLKEKIGIGTRQELMLYAIQHGIAKVARFHDAPFIDKIST